MLEKDDLSTSIYTNYTGYHTWLRDTILKCRWKFNFILALKIVLLLCFEFLHFDLKNQPANWCKF